MQPQNSRPSIHYGASSPPEHYSGVAYDEFLENRHKLHGGLDNYS